MTLRPLAAAILLLAAGPGTPALAGVVRAGEALLSREVEVRASPDAASPVVTKLPKGTVVMALGSPRHSGFNQIALRGREIGYVPNEVLLSIDGPREVTGHVAAVSRRLAPEGFLYGSHAVRRPVTAVETRKGKRKSVKLEAGAVLALVGMRGGKASFAWGDGTIELDPAAVLPVAGVYERMPVTGATFHLARLGEHPNPASAYEAWRRLAHTLPLLAPYTPFAYPAASGEGYTLAFGPFFQRSEAEATCTALSRQLLNCWLVEGTAF